MKSAYGFAMVGCIIAPDLQRFERPTNTRITTANVGQKSGTATQKLRIVGLVFPFRDLSARRVRRGSPQANSVSFVGQAEAEVPQLLPAG